jgi:hypothetical protein
MPFVEMMTPFGVKTMPLVEKKMSLAAMRMLLVSWT